MRQSTINEADICGYRTKLRLENPDQPRKTSVARAIGTGAHAGLAAGYLSIMRGEEPSLEAMVEEGVHDLEAELFLHSDVVDWRWQVATSRAAEEVYTFDDCVEKVTDALTRYVAQDLWWPRPRYQVVGVEQPFNMSWIDGWDRTGTMDLVVLDSETGWYHIVDHKFTKRKWPAAKATAKASVQAAWYIDAARLLYGTRHVTFNYDVFSFGGDFQRIDAGRSDEQIVVTMKRAELLADLIEKGGPYQPNVQSFLCSEAYCDYWGICPFGAVLAGDGE